MESKIHQGTQAFLQIYTSNPKWQIAKHFVWILLTISRPCMIARALILTKVFGVTQGKHMTNFADIKLKLAILVSILLIESLHNKMSCVT